MPTDSLDFDLDIDIDLELDFEDSNDDALQAAPSGPVASSPQILRHIPESRMDDSSDSYDLFELDDDDDALEEIPPSPDLLAPSKPLSTPPPPPPPIQAAPTRKSTPLGKSKSMSASSEQRVIGRLNITSSSASTSMKATQSSALKELQRRKQELEGECLALEAQLEQTRRKLNDRDGKLHKLEAALTDSVEQLARSEANRMALAEQLAVEPMPEPAISGVFNEVTDQEIADQLARINELEFQLDQVSVDSEEQISQKIARIERLEHDLHRVKDDAKSREITLISRITKLESTVNQLAEMGPPSTAPEEEHQLQREIESLRFRIQTLEPALEMARRKNETYRNDLHVLRKGMEEANSDVGSARNAQARAEEKLREVEELHNTQKAELDALKRRIAEAERTNQDDADEQRALKEAREARIRSLKAHIEALEADKGRLEESLLSERHVSRQIESRVSELQAESFSANLEQETLHNQVETLKREAERAALLEERVEELELALATARANAPSFGEPGDDFIEHELDLSDEDFLGALDILSEPNHEQLEDMREQLAQLESRLTNTERERDIFKAELHEAHASIHHLNSDLSAEMEGRANLDASISALQARNDDLQRTVHAMHSENEVLRADSSAAEENELLHHRLEHLESRVNVLESDNLQLQSNNEALYIDAEDARRLAEHLEARLANSVSAEEVQRLQRRIQESEVMLASVKATEAQVESLRAEYDDLAEAYEAIQQSHFERGKQLMSSLADGERMRANLVRIAQELSAVREEADAMERHNEQIQTQNAGLLQQVEEVKEKLEASNARSLRPVEQTNPDPMLLAERRKLVDMGKQLEDLQRELATARSKVAQTNGDIKVQSFNPSPSPAAVPLFDAPSFDSVNFDSTPGFDDNSQPILDEPLEVNILEDDDDAPFMPPRPTGPVSISKFGIEERDLTFDRSSVDDAFDDSLLSDDMVFDDERAFSASKDGPFSPHPQEKLFSQTERSGDDTSNGMDGNSTYLGVKHEQTVPSHEPEAEPFFEPPSLDHVDVHDLHMDDEMSNSVLEEVDKIFGSADHSSEEQFFDEDLLFDDAVFGDLDNLGSSFESNLDSDAHSIPNESNAGGEFGDASMTPFEHLETKGLLEKRPSADFSAAKGVDHRAGFLLAMANGDTTIKDIIDLSGSVLNSADAAELVVKLIDSGALRI